MSRNVRYVQCAMRRNIARGSVRTTSYIPQEFAKVGRVLRLKDDKVGWVDGWVVECVGDSIVEGDQIPDSHKAIKNHRKLTGDSAPRLNA
ncbi:hypothetical protein [Rubripirellula reticaptiva]|uniref:Uncharacterized protein n=1 Tax=Rubripirellula reticaptiva TaxID=2528013 RepID=A0A5C6EGX3_9BACT|nr:hypothetical protein [Rubripirellula reticaptiva]TWU46489.1 hypothetical protein Poly59_54500 [Rubripirellula reticaptiva]